MFTDLVDIDNLELYNEDKAEMDRELIDEEAKKAKFRLLGPLGKAHNIMVHIRSSGGRTEHFRKLAGRMIPMDNRTRWNSWFNMLVVLLNLRPAVEKYC